MSKPTNRRLHSATRVSENFSEDGLETLTGQSPKDWGRYVIKELVDNALDYVETPTITIEYDDSGRIYVEDDGPGMDLETVGKVFKDVDHFVGSKQNYALPTRGAQGNALMTIAGIQHVSDSTRPIRIHSQGRRYDLRYADNELDSENSEYDPDGSDVDGFAVDVDLAKRYVDTADIRDTIEKFIVLNPHAEFIVNDVRHEATGSIESYSGDDIGRVTWYSLDDFENLLTADAEADPDMTLEEFVKQFWGLKTKAAGLCEEFNADRATNLDETERFYMTMCEATQPISDSSLDTTLGSVGRDLTDQLLDTADTELAGVDLDPTEAAVYKADGDVVMNNGRETPFYFEVAAVPVEPGVPTRSGDVTFGINKSVAYSQPSTSLTVEKKNMAARASSIHGAFNCLDNDNDHRFAVVINLTCPNIGFQDKGKQSFNTKPFMDVIEDVLGKVIRNLENNVRARLNDAIKDDEPEPEPELDGKAHRGFITETFDDIFWDVYETATAGWKYEIQCRNLYYVYREHFMDVAEEHGYRYSCQASVDDLKPLELDYDSWRDNHLAELEAEEGRRLALRDDRGVYIEPHSGREIPLGTNTVRYFTPDENQQNQLLYVEKTGLKHMLRGEWELDKQYDIGAVLAAGQQTNAGRKLVEKIQRDIDGATMYALTDFDVAGVGIADNVGEASAISDIDTLDVEQIGLRLEDVEHYDLTPERVDLPEKDETRLEHLHEDGVITDEEYDYLSGAERDDGFGQRVELDALTPDQLRDLLERKFEELELEKVEPDVEDVEEPDEDFEDVAEDVVHDIIIEESDVMDDIDIPDRFGEEFEDIGTDAEDIREAILEELADFPPKNWEAINEDELDEVAEKRDDLMEGEFEEWVRESFEFEVTVRPK